MRNFKLKLPLVAGRHRSIIEMLTDDVLLEIFDWLEMGYAGACVQKMATYRHVVWICGFHVHL